MASVKGQCAGVTGESHGFIFRLALAHRSALPDLTGVANLAGSVQVRYFRVVGFARIDTDSQPGHALGVRLRKVASVPRPIMLPNRRSSGAGQERRSWVPVARCAPAPAQLCRLADEGAVGVELRNV